MCTAISFKTKDFYFGRTLDHDLSYAEEVTVVPRNAPLPFRSQGTLEHHYAMVGMAHVVEGYPLLFDGVNEKGLAMAGLNFVGYARYRQPEAQRTGFNGEDVSAGYLMVPTNTAINFKDNDFWKFLVCLPFSLVADVLNMVVLGPSTALINPWYEYVADVQQ